MNKRLIILILISNFILHVCGQNVDSSKVISPFGDSIASCSYENHEGIIFTIKYNSQNYNSRNLIFDMIFENPTDSIRTIYWEYFNKNNYIPVNFTYTIIDSTGKKLADHYCSLYQMESWIIKKMKNICMKYDITSGKSFKRTVELPYYFNYKGKYKLQLFYSDILTTYLTSNILDFEIK